MQEQKWDALNFTLRNSFSCRIYNISVKPNSPDSLLQRDIIVHYYDINISSFHPIIRNLKNKRNEYNIGYTWWRYIIDTHDVLYYISTGVIADFFLIRDEKSSSSVIDHRWDEGLGLTAPFSLLYLPNRKVKS